MKEKVDNSIKYPVGLQNFERLRQDGYLYIDKTAMIYNLINTGKYYFLSRPRRFGKSLLLSTIEAYYKGRRDLFSGLEIDNLSDDWSPHPVLHLDLTVGAYQDINQLIESLGAQFEVWEAKYCPVDTVMKENALSLRFANIIRSAYQHTGKRVVILVDEYDKPLLSVIDQPEMADEYRIVLKSVYSNLKSLDGYIEFAMMTGVARFSKVSIFSDLNNLRDISFEPTYAAICGITEQELLAYCNEGVENLAQQYAKTPEQILLALRTRYDGYHFSEISPDIYNPFSLMNVFASGRMRDYWFETGTPGYLVEVIKRSGIPLHNIVPSYIRVSRLAMAGIADEDPVPALYQSGYLTIKSYDEHYDRYLLDYPNEEVKSGFVDFLLPYYLGKDKNSCEFDIARFSDDIANGNIENFMKRLDALISGLPYSEKGSKEDHFQNAIYLIFTLVGVFARVERRTSDGRIDMVVETSDKVYIFEFKVDKSASEALAQIREKDYARPYMMSGKSIYLIGAAFSTQTGRLTDYKITTNPD